MDPPWCGLRIQMLCLALLLLISSSSPEAVAVVSTAGSSNAESSSASALSSASTSSSCTPSMVWRHQSPSHLFAIKRQASCLFQGLMWEVGKKKETTHGLKVFERFADAAAAVNAALVEQGLEPLKITHSNVQSSGAGAFGTSTGGNNGLANRLQANAVRTGDISAVAAEAAASAVAAALSASRPANTHHVQDEAQARDVLLSPLKSEDASKEVVNSKAEAPNLAELLPEDDKDIEPEQEEAAAARYEARHQLQQQQQQGETTTVARAQHPQQSSEGKHTNPAVIESAPSQLPAGADSKSGPRSSTSRSGSSRTSGAAKKSVVSSTAVHKLLAPTAPHRDSITQLVVVGERNTGTNWLFRTLEENFNVTVLNHFCGWKHFFHNPSQCSKAEKKLLNNTLAVVLWKNVFDWTLSMHRNPYHMHMHFRNSFSDFIRRPMALVDTYELSASDLVHDVKNVQFKHRPLAHNLSTNPRDELFRYSSGEYCEKALPRHLQWQYDAFCADSPQFLHEFNPPFYELNPDTHRPFANLLRMRSAKIKNFRNMQTWMPNVAHVRFEELLAEGGQGSLEWMFGLSEQWKLAPKRPQFELVVNNPKHPGELFNCTEYEAKLYYSSCLRGLSAECCDRMAIHDATFIHEQLDRHLETNELQYVMPQVRDLCAQHQAQIDAALLLHQQHEQEVPPEEQRE